MPIQLSSNALNGTAWAENSDTVVVTRYNKIGATWTTSVVYSGVCDLQEGTGDIQYNEAGVVTKTDAKCFIDGNIGIALDDEMVFNQNANQTYVVVSTSQWSMFPIHTELELKRGGIAYVGKT